MGINHVAHLGYKDLSLLLIRVLVFDQPWCKGVMVVLVTVSWEKQEQLENGVVVVDSPHIITLVEEKISRVNWVLGKCRSVWKCIHFIKRGFILVEKCKLLHWFLYDLCWKSSLIGIIKFGAASQVTTERVFVDHDWHQ